MDAAAAQPVCPEPIAIDVDEVRRYGGPGRTRAFQAIHAGELRARKMGKRTIVLLSDLREYLEGLPLASAADAPSGAGE